MLFYNKTVTATLKELGSRTTGISAKEAAARLAEYGPNRIRVAGDPLWRKILQPFLDIFMLVLGAAAVISFAQGHVADAYIIFGIMIINAAIYYVQRASTERILRALKSKNKQFIRVLRDGTEHSVDTETLVPGDVLVLAEGDKVPADARIVTCANLRVNESSLTGESVPINKHAEALRGEKPTYEQANLLFQGSFIVAGEATAAVTQTGNNTEFGKLAQLTQSDELRSPLQKKVDILVNKIIIVAAAIAIMAFILSLLRGTELTEALRFVIALAVGVVPEGLPIAITIILALGVRRMAAKKALVRNMRAIETVGLLTTIASDKTGTLTKNQLTVQEIWQPRNQSSHALLETAAASINRRGDVAHDPVDAAIALYGSAAQAASRRVALYSLPFRQDVAMSGNTYKTDDGYEVIVKGAPERLIERSLMTEEERETAVHALHRLTSSGYRVIAFGHLATSRAVTSFDDLGPRQRFTFDGLFAIADTLRPEAKKAITTATKAGVTVRMITGDHFETAYHIGQELGIVKHKDQVFDCSRMHTMTDQQLHEAVKHARVFSRVLPESKYRLLGILKQSNITAMTGDGVNDVPALASAHVGIAMGSGTEIAKDAGDIILLDDNFKTIIDAMEEGRVIVSNIRHMISYLLATNAGEALTMIGALLLGFPPPLAAVQILWVNLVTDTALVIPLGLEKGERDVMRQKPESANAPILSRFMIGQMLVVAVTMALLALGTYLTFLPQYGFDYANTLVFSALVVMQWANAFVMRSSRESILRRLLVPNPAFYIGLAVAIGLQLVAFFSPLQHLLHITPVNYGHLGIVCFVAFVTPLVVAEAHKWLARKRA